MVAPSAIQTQTLAPCPTSHPAQSSQYVGFWSRTKKYESALKAKDIKITTNVLESPQVGRIDKDNYNEGGDDEYGSFAWVTDVTQMKNAKNSKD
jgi:hypothetical protein